ncbi:MAG: MOSC domain-containing protein [Methylococcales bacterium]
MLSVSGALADERKGLLGDRYNGSSGSRHLSLIQWEHLAVLESLTGRGICPELLRRNLVIKGINLLALKNQRISIGKAIVEVTGYCHPCSKMESKLGAGGYNEILSILVYAPIRVRRQLFVVH